MVQCGTFKNSTSVCDFCLVQCGTFLTASTIRQIPGENKTLWCRLRFWYRWYALYQCTVIPRTIPSSFNAKIAIQYSTTYKDKSYRIRYSEYISRKRKSILPFFLAGSNYVNTLTAKIYDTLRCVHLISKKKNIKLLRSYSNEFDPHWKLYKIR